MSKNEAPTQSTITKDQIKPRNDYVVLERIDMGVTAGGVVVPGTSQENKTWVVVAAGPKVTDLTQGMRVEPMGTMGEDIAPLPGSYPRNLFITKEANVLLWVEE